MFLRSVQGFIIFVGWPLEMMASELDEAETHLIQGWSRFCLLEIQQEIYGSIILHTCVSRFPTLLLNHFRVLV